MSDTTSDAGTRQRLYLLLEGPPEEQRIRAWVQFGLLAVIVISTIALIIETLPELSGRRLFLWIEVVTIVVFTSEYLLRVWISTEDPRFQGAVTGRLRYMVTPYALIDLAAVLPFYLAFLPLDLRFLRMVRLLRLLRLAKLTRHFSALQLLGRVVIERRYELVVTMLLAGILLIMASAAMYYAEHDAQPEAFSSMPSAMWWAIATLTTVGYGDIAPVTALGRLLGGVIAVLGIGMFALPTGILGASFVDEVQKRKHGSQGRCPTCGQEILAGPP